MLTRQRARERDYLTVTKAVGKPLFGIIIHHLDGDWRNGERDNLIVCPDRSYHMLLHRRTDALRGRKCEPRRMKYQECFICKEYTHINNMVKYKNTGRWCHAGCFLTLLMQ